MTDTQKRIGQVKRQARNSKEAIGMILSACADKANGDNIWVSNFNFDKVADLMMGYFDIAPQQPQAPVAVASLDPYSIEVRIEDHDIFDSLTSGLFARYLRGKGWTKKPSEGEGGAMDTYQLNGDELWLPVKRFTNHAMLMRIAFRALAYFEGKNELLLLSQIKGATVETVAEATTHLFRFIKCRACNRCVNVEGIKDGDNYKGKCPWCSAKMELMPPALPELMTFGKFVDCLHLGGWMARGDAQYNNIEVLYDMFKVGFTEAKAIEAAPLPSEAVAATSSYEAFGPMRVDQSPPIAGQAVSFYDEKRGEWREGRYLPFRDRSAFTTKDKKGKLKIYSVDRAKWWQAPNGPPPAESEQAELDKAREFLKENHKTIEISHADIYGDCTGIANARVERVEYNPQTQILWILISCHYDDYDDYDETCGDSDCRGDCDVCDINSKDSWDFELCVTGELPGGIEVRN